MASSVRDSFARCCRLCAEEQDVTIMIFSAEAEAMLLQNKLNKYLLIEVDENDKLPKNICIKCCSKLQVVCDFIDTARDVQTLLLNRSLDLDQVLNEKSLYTLPKHEIKSEPKSRSDEKAQSTEMEGSVDPIEVLQNSKESRAVPQVLQSGGSPKIYKNGTSIEDVTHLHDVDSDNVTIKLIRNGGRVAKNSHKNKYKQRDKDLNLKPFLCITCKKGFFTDLALKNHSWSHTNEYREEKTLKCDKCNSLFYYKIDLINHLREHNTKGLCQFCGACFKSKNKLGIHLSTHHPSNSSYNCKICGKSYKTENNLKTHSFSHRNKRQFQCHICKKYFKKKQDLRLHLSQHNGVKPFKCPFCDKSFGTSGSCYSHRSRMHPGRTAETILKQQLLLHQ